MTSYSEQKKQYERIMRRTAKLRSTVYCPLPSECSACGSSHRKNYVQMRVRGSTGDVCIPCFERMRSEEPPVVPHEWIRSCGNRECANCGVKIESNSRIDAERLEEIERARDRQGCPGKTE